MRAANVEGTQERSMRRFVSLSCSIFSPRVGWLSFTVTVIFVEGPKGLEDSWNSIGVEVVKQTIGI